MSEKKTRSVKRTVSNIVIGVILGLSVLLVAVLFINKAKSKPTFIFGRSIAWIITDSMEDTIPAQTFIFIEEVKADDVSVGDVIIFRSENPALQGGYNTHRVVSINEDRSVFTTKGDHNLADDGQYSAKAENIVGRYIRNLPVLTALMRFFSSPVGFILLILFVIALTVCMFIPDIKKYLRKSDEDEKAKKEEEKRRLIEEEIERLKKGE